MAPRSAPTARVPASRAGARGCPASERRKPAPATEALGESHPPAVSAPRPAPPQAPRPARLPRSCPRCHWAPTPKSPSVPPAGDLGRRRAPQPRPAPPEHQRATVSAASRDRESRPAGRPPRRSVQMPLAIRRSRLRNRAALKAAQPHRWRAATRRAREPDADQAPALPSSDRPEPPRRLLQSGCAHGERQPSAAGAGLGDQLRELQRAVQVGRVQLRARQPGALVQPCRRCAGRGQARRSERAVLRAVLKPHRAQMGVKPADTRRACASAGDGRQVERRARRRERTRRAGAVRRVICRLLADAADLEPACGRVDLTAHARRRAVEHERLQKEDAPQRSAC